MDRIIRWLADKLTGEGVRGEECEPLPAVRGQASECTTAVFDLADNWHLTFALLDDTRAWRERAVHEIVLRDSDHVDASLAYQIRLPLELIHQFEPRVQVGDQIRLLLPFTVRPKQLLLNVDFTGVEDKSVALLLRQEAAEIQAQYIAHVSGRPLSDQPLGGALWVGVSAFTVSAWQEHRARTKPRTWRRLLPGSQKRWHADALAAYLDADLNLGIEVHQVIDWLRKTEPARAALVEALDEGEDPESSSECILLAIPFMPFRPGRIADIDILVDEYVAAVSAMDLRTRQVLAEFGRRWEAIIDTVVPVDRGCTVKLSEQRPWLRAPSPAMEQEIAFGDSTSTHVEIRAADHGVVLGSPDISDLVGHRVGIAVGDSQRETADAVAIYASDPERPYFARVSVRARLRRGHRMLILWLLVLIAAAGVVAVELPENGDLVESLALLIFPLTLAGAVVLSREATSLAERLLRRWRFALIAAIAGLWIVTLVRLLHNADVEWAISIWSGIKNVIGTIESPLR